MSLSTYHHGTRVLEVLEGARPIRLVSTAVIGLVATATDADQAFFPADKPVLVTSIRAAIAKAGVQGTLKKSLEAIAAQCDPVMVVVRVPEGVTAAETTTNVIGGVNEDGQYTGMQALLAAQSQLGVKPRILGAPGLDVLEVAKGLAGIAKKLRGFAYAKSQGATIAEHITYRAGFDERELMLITPDFMAWNAQASASTSAPAVAYALGLRSLIDQEQGWHKTLSNVAVSGVTGISQAVHWDLQSSDTDAGKLNEADITTLINQTGYRFWGSRTCSDDELFEFESATRTAQVLADTIAEQHFWAVDKPMHPSIVKDILEGVNAKFRELKSRGYILDGQAWYDPEMNTAASMKSGQLVIDYDYTPIPPIEDLAFQQRITDRYFSDFASRVAKA